MVASIIFLWSIIAAAQAQAPSADGAQTLWSMANISLTVVDYSTPKQNIQIGFSLNYPNKTQTYDNRCSVGPSSGPMVKWKPCGYDSFHVRTTNVVVAHDVEF